MAKRVAQMVNNMNLIIKKVRKDEKKRLLSIPKGVYNF